MSAQKRNRDYFAEAFHPLSDGSHPIETEAHRRIRSRHPADVEKVSELQDWLLVDLDGRAVAKQRYLELEAAETHLKSLTQREFYNMGVVDGLERAKSRARLGVSTKDFERSHINIIRNLLRLAEEHLRILEA